MGTITYEPRALWSIKTMQATAAVGSVFSPSIGRFAKEHFRNGWKHPITLTHMLVAPIGYLLQDWDGSAATPTGSSDRHNCGTAIQQCKFFVRSPGRQMFTLDDLPSPTFTPEPREDIAGALPYSSSMLGITRWVFDKPLTLPHDYTIDFRLGGALLQPLTTVATAPDVAVSFEEDGVGTDEPGSSFRSNVRSLRASMPWRNLDDAFPFPNSDAVQTPSGGTSNAWPWRFGRSDFRRQIVSRAGPTNLRAFSVAIDQIAYDLGVQSVTSVSGHKVGSLALRTPSRCRIIDAGSQAEWWRPGAPLALVTPSMTPAQVYQLAKPITLHKGDCLDVEMEIPAGILVTGGEGSVSIRPSYRMGVSFTGYAAIEG